MGKTYQCGRCTFSATSWRELDNHKRKHASVFTCEKCGGAFSRRTYLSKHSSRSCLRKIKKDRRALGEGLILTAVTCRSCGAVFRTRRELVHHRLLKHQVGGGVLQASPFSSPLWEERGVIVDESLKKIYSTHKTVILAPHRRGKVTSIFNFPLANEFDTDEFMKHVEEIYQEEHQTFRLNLSFGFILQHVETEEYRYFYAHNCTSILQKPAVISSSSDLEKLRKTLQTLDVIEQLLVNRPNTKYRVTLLTNVVVTISKSNFSLGSPSDLPDFINKSKCIMSLHGNKKGRRYDDNKCFFRALAHHLTTTEVEQTTNALLRRWEVEVGTEDVTVEDMPALENFFEVNIQIYCLNEDGTAKNVYNSCGHHSNLDTMYLNQYGNHISYITNVKGYCRKFQCRSCDKNFSRSWNCKRHMRTCKGSTNYIYRGGHFSVPKTVFQELLEVGIEVPEEEQFYPWFAVYDFESILEKVSNDRTPKMEWITKHVPISFAVSSNVLGFTSPHCVVNEDIGELVTALSCTLSEIQVNAYELARSKWEYVYDGLENLRQVAIAEGCLREELYGTAPLSKEKEKDEDEIILKQLDQLKMKFEKYCKQLPVLGFNSAKYDLNLIKSKLAQVFELHEETGMFTVKRNNSYICISTNSMKFLDISQFLCPGTSYDDFLRSFHCSVRKGFYPYEWMDCVSKLNHPRLPPIEAFWSTLKGCNVLEVEHIAFEKLMQGGLTEHNALKRMKLEVAPPTKEEVYDSLQNIWDANNMKTFKDWLEWYNLLDVAPFVEGVERMQLFYKEKNIDLFKVAISVPGIARTLLFRAAAKQKCSFGVFGKKDKDLYHKIKNNIVGGPSIIFTRHHKVGETRIRSGDKTCGNIVGFDANALYLSCLGSDMPVGGFVRRKADNSYRADCRDKWRSMYDWMDWMNETYGLSICHRMNNGKEKKVGCYYADGYDASTNTVYEYNGCYFHGCPCTGKYHFSQEGQDRYLATLKRSDCIKKRGFTVIEMKECTFTLLIKENEGLSEFIQKKQPAFFSKTGTRPVKQDTILASVKQGEFFGMIECDLHVPDKWEGDFTHTLSPKQYYEEMSPLFCSSDIPFDIIGDHMQAYAKKKGLSEKPRRLLVGGMKAKQLLIASPLLKWYLDHGLVVSYIHEAIEFGRQRCFKPFMDDVTAARRSGDKDSSLGVMASTMKLIGNSGFGSLIMDKTKHQNIKYVNDHVEACKAVNEPRFRKITEIGDDYFELEMAKKNIKLDLPIQLGYWILQLGKLRMLEFYFDFMDRYCKREDFEYIEMDTDSAYMAISGCTLRTIIKPCMLAKYDHGLNDYCHLEEVEADTSFHWFPRECCVKHMHMDKRTPGLFKVEFEGQEMIALCSKTYMVQGETEIKFSCKGLNKRMITDPAAVFKRVLLDQESGVGINVGFRQRNNTMFTYSQERAGFTYFYCKRNILNDGIHSTPLDITLCPVIGEP